MQRTIRICAVGVVLGVVSASPGIAQPSAERDVVRRSYWDATRRTILTDVDVRRADGTVERRTVLGGTVDGMGMIQLASGVGTAPFVPSRTSDGTRLRWAGTCVTVRTHPSGTSHLPAGQEEVVLAAVLAHWEAATRDCGYLRLAADASETGEVGLDYVNRLVYREETWCRPDSGLCYDEEQVGLTTLFFIDQPSRADHGTIVDADIEINAVHYAIAICDGTPGGCASDGMGARYDLAAVLTHEVGHLLGLAHTCWNGVPPSPLDGEEQPVPLCGAPEAEEPAIREATMYPRISAESIDQASVEVDDINGFCALYPRAADPGVCEPITPPTDAGTVPPPDGDDAGGCGCDGSRPSGGALALLAFSLVALRPRRRLS